MDPDDLPTIFFAPQSQHAKSAKAFEDILFDELSEEPPDLPLDRFCLSAGWGDEYDLQSVSVVEFLPDSVTGLIKFTFVEHYFGGCRDIDFTDTHRASMEFSFDRKTGELALTGGITRRNYEREEF